MQKNFVIIEDVQLNGKEIVFATILHHRFNYFNLADSQYLCKISSNGDYYKHELAPDLSGVWECYDAENNGTYSDREFHEAIEFEGKKYYPIGLNWVVIQDHEFDIEICDTLDESLSILFDEFSEGFIDLGGYAGMYYSGKDDKEENTIPNLKNFLFELCTDLTETAL